MMQSISNYIQQDISSQLKQCWYTTNYNYRALFQYEIQAEAYLLGEKVREKQVVVQIVNHTFWFTYRKDFQPYKHQGISVTTDSGWGCMIRVGQMMVAQLMCKHLKCFYCFDPMKSSECVMDILQMFQDNDDNESEKRVQHYKYPFSIQKFMRLGMDLWQRAPGEWYSPNQIVYAIDKMIKNSQIQQLVGFEFISFFENMLDIQEIIIQMCMRDCCKCGDKQKPLNCIQLLSSIEKAVQSEQNPEEIEIIQNSTSMFRKKSLDMDERLRMKVKSILMNELCSKCFVSRKAVGICLLTRIGCDHPNPVYLNVIKQFMRRPYFQGVIGGRPKLANYIIGFMDDKFIYLDPHLVQSAQPTQQEEHLHSYFTKDVMYMNESEIDCSCGIAFYLRDFDDLAELLTDLYQQKQNLFFAIGSKRSTGRNYSEKQLEVVENRAKEYKCKLDKQMQDIVLCDSGILNESQFIKSDPIKEQEQSICDYSIVDEMDSSFENLQ